MLNRAFPGPPQHPAMAVPSTPLSGTGCIETGRGAQAWRVCRGLIRHLLEDSFPLDPDEGAEQESKRWWVSPRG